jgi:hypothetical protein
MQKTLHTNKASQIYQVCVFAFTLFPFLRSCPFFIWVIFPFRQQLRTKAGDKVSYITDMYTHLEKVEQVNTQLGSEVLRLCSTVEEL